MPPRRILKTENSMARYRIPKSRTRIEMRVSNSRFIATVAPVASMDEARIFLREIRVEMSDATHHVHAFKVGYGASVSEGMSDDGEPSGTSGPPVLAVLRGADIGDIALVVTRYFGGTKLGTGGLVSAYTAAAQAVLEALPTEEKIDRIGFQVVVPYNLHQQARRLLDEHQCVIEHEEFGADIQIRYVVAVERADALSQDLANISAGRIQPELT